MERKTDQFWQDLLRQSPVAPEPWTDSYLVPSEQPVDWPAF